MKKLSIMLSKRLILVLFVIFLFLIIASSNDKKTSYVANINGVKSLEAMHIIQKYNNLEEDKLTIRPVANMSEAKLYGTEGPVSFVGQMTAYGPDCVGCSGYVACPPKQYVGNDIYYNDVEYGDVRILAADKNIPCGSIIKISNLSYTNEILTGIVLDRGSAIKGNIIDLLEKSEKTGASLVGRQKNVLYEIIRWGW